MQKNGTLDDWNVVRLPVLVPTMLNENSAVFFKKNSCFWQIACFFHPNQNVCQLYFDVCQTILMLSYALYLQYAVYNLSFFLPVSTNVCHWWLTAYQCQRGSKTAGVHTTFAFIIPFVGGPHGKSWRTTSHPLSLALSPFTHFLSCLSGTPATQVLQHFVQSRPLIHLI